MKAASLVDIKKELREMDSEQMAAMLLRLAKFKKDNKELLTYLIFEAPDEDAYIDLIKEYVDDALDEVNTHSYYYAKKNIRKILRQLNKYIRYSGEKRTELELLLYFCLGVQKRDINIHGGSVLKNMYQSQVKKIKAAYGKLHADLQTDYKQEVEKAEDYL
ncbi:hypothetical protein [Fulvivirga sediminis]|uniref:Uncharacterized protein n=1 Tax=Fulvivirga sediminis TaxID=2803949 RepID=A0A937JX27_9BACT|nr:hypothetical protein [Fulvivirga sediminis]MBL3655088.1 hypothetical protein [Fulvivirga sediminis]